MWFLIGFQNRLGYCYFYTFKVIHIIAMTMFKTWCLFENLPVLPLLIKLAALGNLKVNFHCAHWNSFFPLRKASPLISVYFNSLYDPFGSPCRGQKRCSNRCAIRMADHQKSALVFCAGWDRLAVLLGPLPSGEETILQKGLYTLLWRRSKMAVYI